MPLEIVRNDITVMAVDAIVNAANPSLLGGGGVDGAIHRAAGPRLLEACRKLGGCETGDAKITKGYNLPARYVIHTVGPVWHGGDRGEEALLASCYRRSLELARKHRCKTVAFPMISAGAYGYPKDQALAVAVDAIGRFLLENEMKVYLVVFVREEYTISKKLFRDVQSYIDDHYADTHSRPRIQSLREQLWRENTENALRTDQALARREEEGGFLPELSAGHAPQAKPRPQPMAAPRPDWDRLLRETDEGFSGMLLRKIDEKGMTDAACYKKANVDRKLFSKIRVNPSYKPSKPTVFAFAIALELDLDETKELLQKAGFALTHSSKFDIVLEYFIQNRRYDVFEINEVLFHYDMPLLGC